MKPFTQTLLETVCPALWETDLVFQWALTASLLILTVLTIRWALRKKLSSRVRYALWALVLVRLLLPFQAPIALPAASVRAELPYELDHPTVVMYPDLRTEGVSGALI